MEKIWKKWSTGFIDNYKNFNKKSFEGACFLCLERDVEWGYYREVIIKCSVTS